MWIALPLVLQGLAMVVDEGVFHRRRGLPRWERIGHPLDTATIALCLIARLLGAPLAVYAAFAIFSTLFVTKDEAVHAKLCTAGEHWLHSILFVLHPIVLAALWFASPGIVAMQLAIVTAFALYQVIYWNRRDRNIDNKWYGELGARWYEADDTPIALLRAEARHRNPWLAGEIARVFGGSARVLDLGCGAGFLANELAALGHAVTGLDPTAENLDVARAYDRTGRVEYLCGDARDLPFPPNSFDVVCAMDLLEHVDDPARVIAEAARVLRPGGLFFFHTFNRTWLAGLVVIKGVELFVANAPRDLHVLDMFVTPAELATACTASALSVVELRGSRPRFDRAMWRMLATGRVGDDFSFTFTRSTKLGYTGFARKAA
jgi:2-polyprenyl-6-hydroxyphenyl methylase / 3-demethylubiquinone-9 3-methyltransferase